MEGKGRGILGGLGILDGPRYLWELLPPAVLRGKVEDRWRPSGWQGNGDPWRIGCLK